MSEPYKKENDPEYLKKLLRAREGHYGYTENCEYLRQRIAELEANAPPTV